MKTLWVYQDGTEMPLQVSDIFVEPEFPTFKDILNENHRQKVERWKSEHKLLLARQDVYIVNMMCLKFIETLKLNLDVDLQEDALSSALLPILNERHLQYAKLKIVGSTLHVEYAYMGSQHSRKFAVSTARILEHA